MSGKQSWSQAEKILCVRLDSLGDVLMTTPALRAVKESRPYCHLTLLTSPAGAVVESLVPEIDEIIAYDAPWIKATAARRDSAPEYGMAEYLRHSNFDAAIIFTVYSQNPLPAAFLCYMAEIPLRLAYCHENPYQLLTNWIPDPEPDTVVRHEVKRQLDLVATVGSHTNHERLSLHIPPPVRHNVTTLLTELGLDLERGWIVIHPGATAPSRRYPPDKFAAVARQLMQKFDCQVVFTGTGAEQELVAGIQAAVGAPTYSLVNHLNLSELAALLDLAPVIVSNNSAPVHIAAAVGTPVVNLYALTNPQHTPWLVPHRLLFHDVPCKYCYKSVCPEQHHNCLRLVPPEAVVQAALELLEQRTQAGDVIHSASLTPT